MDPNRYEESGAQGPPQDGSQIGNQGQWQGAPGGTGLLGAAPIAAAGLARGATVVNSPTIAKIGEAGPEMVVPLKARAGNRIQPDVLEGRLSQPKVPGVRYSRYKTFTDRSY
jgi:hypothetical protein